MKVAGVIAEYNPFHNGHKYQLDEIKKRTGADHIVVAMSGNFVQRGVPAIVNKYYRAQMALSCGADLVIEIPTVWATASAEHYALAGVSILQMAGCDHICFGAEDDELETFKEYAAFLNSEDVATGEKIKTYVKSGLSYPSARMNAFLDSHPLKFSKEVLSKPNNTLAIEYLRALEKIHPKMEPVLIPRKGAAYNQTQIDFDGVFASATAVRQALFAGEENADISSQLPSVSNELLPDFDKKYGFVHPDDMSSLLAYRLLCEKDRGFGIYADCSSDLSGAIEKNLKSYESFSQFADLLKTKNYTHTRITRTLLHILLQIKSDDYIITEERNYCSYLRILGFNKNASELLHRIKKEASVPLITKVADASSILSEEKYMQFKIDLLSADIYNLMVSSHGKDIPENEFIHGPIITSA